MSGEPMIGVPDDTPDLSEAIEQAKRDLQATVRGDDAWRHPDLITTEDIVNMAAPMPIEYRAAHDFLSAIFGPDGYPPDTVAQLVEVFLPCLKIMVDHNWGELWRKAGFNSLMVHTGSKFERYWERTWIQGKRHADSGFDAINFLGFTLRADPDDIWGTRGKPAWGDEGPGE
jgi:hypothetical protein